mmetsp:Transcript_137890/g.239707  ORF Transcript_137890/g.239707 Transcript_137890/m.239707 type:complete len:200 (+) Transcript_137890:1952-2551(+)
MELRLVSLIPELRHLHGAALLRFWCQVEPLRLQVDISFDEHLGQDAGLGQLTQVENDALALRNEVKPVRKALCELYHRMIRARHLDVNKLAIFDSLLTSFHTHSHPRNKHFVLSDSNLSLPHHKPLACTPFTLELLRLQEVGAALHAYHGLGVLSHGKLFKMIIRLEHHLANTRACQPLRLEALLLHPILLDFCLHWIQ